MLQIAAEHGNFELLLSRRFPEFARGKRIAALTAWGVHAALKENMGIRTAKPGKLIRRSNEPHL